MSDDPERMSIDDDEPTPMFYRDPDEAENQKHIDTSEALYKYIVDGKVYKKSSILKVYPAGVISEVKAERNPHWVEFVDPPKQSKDDDDDVLFYRDPNEATNQKLLKTTEQIYRFVEDDKLYKKGSILRAGYGEEAMSDKLAPPLPNWVEFRDPTPKAKADDDDDDDDKVVPMFFRDPNEKENQKMIDTTEQIYRYVEDNKLYKKSSILKVFGAGVISEELAKPLPTWVEFKSKQ